MENKTFRAFLLLAIVLLALSPIFFSCKAYKERICRECVKSDSTVVKHDSSATDKDLPPDTSLVPFYVEGPVRYLPSPCANLCDSLGHLKPIDIKDHKNGLSSHTFNKGDTLVNECNADSLLKVNQIKERKIRIRDETIRKLCYEVVKPKPETWLDRAKTASFYVMLGSILILLILAFFYARSAILRKIAAMKDKKPG